MIADISSVSKVITTFNRILVKEYKSLKQPNSVQVSLLKYRCIFLKEEGNENSYRQLEELKELWFSSSPSRVPCYPKPEASMKLAFSFSIPNETPTYVHIYFYFTSMCCSFSELRI